MSIHKGPPTRRERLFGGEGAVTVWNLLGASAAPPFTAVLSCELEPSGWVGRHVQEQDPEIVIGLEGDGEATVDDRTLPLAAGDVLHLPLGSILSIRNRASDAPLRYLIIKARPPA